MFLVAFTEFVYLCPWEPQTGQMCSATISPSSKKRKAFDDKVKTS